MTGEREKAEGSSPLKLSRAGAETDGKWTKGSNHHRANSAPGQLTHGATHNPTWQTTSFKTNSPSNKCNREPTHLLTNFSKDLKTYHQNNSLTDKLTTRRSH